MDFLVEMLRQYGLLGIAGVIILVLVLWAAAYRTAKPGTEVSVLWGLIKQTKPGGESRVIPPPPSVEPVRLDIPAESANLLGTVRSTPAGLWLAAEGVTAGRDALLKTARQIKLEYRAEALAHLSLGLAVFNKPKDAREIAKEGLSAALEMRDRVRSYTYTKMAETFADAGLTVQAQQSIELAVEKAQSARHPENFQHLMQVYARLFSADKARSVARAIPDPKTRVEALGSVITHCIEAGEEGKSAGLIEEALQMAESISGFNDRAHAFFDLGRAWMRIGRYQDGAALAKRANLDAEKIGPQELFAELTKKTIANDANLMSNHPMTVLKAAEAQGNPYLLTYIARFMSKRGHDIEQIARSAARLAHQARQSDALADAAHMLHEAGLENEALNAAHQAMDLALGAADRRYRDTPLQKVAEIFAAQGDYEDALSSAGGISAIKAGIESASRVVVQAYARSGNAPARSADLLRRLASSHMTLDDKDRSAALMQLAAGQACLGNMEECAQMAKQAPLSGHRLAAYAMFWMQDRLQTLSPSEVSKMHSARGEMFERLLLPIFGWDIAN